MRDCSIVIACHTEDRWLLLINAIASALAQTHPPAQVIVVVDHNPALVSRLRAEVDGITVLANASVPGASGTRNTGVAHATTPYVAFLDDDMVAQPDWLEHLLEPFRDSEVVGTGGRVEASWQTSRPAWFPAEFDWIVGATQVGMPTANAPVRNVWAESMAVRTSVFRAVSGFRDGFGKLGRHSRPEDTDLCIRMSAEMDGGRWIYAHNAGASHHVPATRATFRFFVQRAYHEGRGKAELARLLPSPARALSSERSYALTVLPRGVVTHVRTAISSRRAQESLRSLAIVVGLASTIYGFLVQSIAELRSEPGPAPGDARLEKQAVGVTP